MSERDDENLKLKNEMNILREQIPGPGVGEEDLIMRAVEERVKKWKVKKSFRLANELINRDQDYNSSS